MKGTGNDDAVLDLVTSASVACGVHAGDPDTMRRTLEAATRRGVVVGAHPSYPDRTGFGRRPLDHGAGAGHRRGALPGTPRSRPCRGERGPGPLRQAPRCALSAHGRRRGRAPRRWPRRSGPRATWSSWCRPGPWPSAPPSRGGGTWSRPRPSPIAPTSPDGRLAPRRTPQPSSTTRPRRRARRARRRAPRGHRGRRDGDQRRGVVDLRSRRHARARPPLPPACGPRSRAPASTVLPFVT